MSQDAKPLKKIINDLLETYRLKSKFNETNITKTWEKVVGPLIAGKTTKIFLNNKILHITLSSAPLKQELLFSKQQLLQLLWDEYGKDTISDIYIY
jgi:predicted nucleic acid-binding Zn ribbon protein